LGGGIGVGSMALAGRAATKSAPTRKGAPLLDPPKRFIAPPLRPSRELSSEGWLRPCALRRLTSSPPKLSFSTARR